MARTTPFLKWVGGKRQLLLTLSKLITHKSLTFYEPFLGGGAVFFHFADRRRFQKAVLNDANPELVNCYEVVRDRLPDLIKRLDAYKRDPDWNTKPYFESVRSLIPTDQVKRAARFIYLNRTSFNGLYRVNQAGKFNAPFGKYDNPSLYDYGTLLHCSEALQQFATLRVGDYATAVQDAQAGDIVYFDPPYVPVSFTASFTSYAGEFGPKQQGELALLFRELVSRGVLTILSNSDTSLVRELYDGFDLHVVRARRNVNSKGDKRGPVNELAVVGKPAVMKVDVLAEGLPIFPVECAGCDTVYNTADIVCPKCGSTKIQD
jgi:DNA adenine methylase